MDLSLWEVAVGLLLAGISYGALWGRVNALAKAVEKKNAETDLEVSQLWKELSEERNASNLSAEQVLIRLAKIDVTLERLIKWAEKTGA